MSSDELHIQDITNCIISYVQKHGLGKNKAYKHLHAQVCSVSKRVRYFGLMEVFSRNLVDDRLRAQTLAGRMLLKIAPKAMERCEEAVFRLLINWDVSAQEVIFYLQSQFGSEKLLAVIVNMESTAEDENDIARLNTMKYWMGIRDNLKEK